MAGARGNIPRRHHGPGQEAAPSPKPSAESSTPSANEAHPTTISPAFLNAVSRLQAQAQGLLHNAIACERGHRWFQAIDYYRKLLCSLNKKKFPSEYVPGPAYSQLVFESYYHMGVAYQKVNCHRDASEVFTYAIEAIDVRKVWNVHNACSHCVHNCCCFEGR